MNKTKDWEGKKNLRKNPSEYDKGKKRWSAEFPFGQGDGDDRATLGRKPATNSATADQYPGCTHVSSTQSSEQETVTKLLRRYNSLCIPSGNSMKVFPPSTTIFGGTLRSSDPDPDPVAGISLGLDREDPDRTSSFFSSSSSSSSSAAPFAFTDPAGSFFAVSRPRLRMMAQRSCICERGTTSSRAPPSISTGILGASFGACREIYVSPNPKYVFNAAAGVLP